MNDILKIEFSQASLLFVLILGVILSIIFGIARKVLIPKISGNRTKQLYHLLEIFIWLAYAFWALQIVLGETIYYMLSVLSIAAVVLIWLGWFIARDFIAGMVLKFSDNFQKGQQFRLGEIEGTIIAADYIQLQIRQEDGTIVKIPYNRISGNIHYKTDTEDRSTKHNFEIIVDGHSSPKEIHEKIRRAILLSPGVCINKEPKIKLKEELVGGYKYEVLAYALDSSYYKQIERNVLMKMSSVKKK